MESLEILSYAGYAAALLTVAAFFMKDTVRLRQIALASNVAYAAWAAGAHLWPTLLLHCVLFPLNLWRLRQLLRERRLIERAMTASDVSPAWLTPFMDRRRFAKDAVLFRRGDPADGLYFLAQGTLIIEELGVELFPGALLGEIGIFSPDGKRTQSVRAEETSIVYVMRRDEVLALYRRDPAFGIYLVRLITSRLVEDVAKIKASSASPPAAGSPPAAPA
ncbi:MAG TPA: cyclic nucleotide-binding domain-containing protein [Candidatus Limnocylindrales bacterium]|nr:cyclic nucleotide-binding domain-containing protein [Candidatus Limnocylindrales bacterium]